MPKQVTSPLKSFPGTVTLPDGYTFPQIIAFDKALDEALRGDKSKSEQWYALLRGLIPCVESWALEGVPEHPTPETFPATPRAEAHKLVSWLLDESQRVQIGEGADPNA